MMAREAGGLAMEPEVLESLPDEVLTVVFSLLPLRDVPAAAATCSRLSQLIKGEDSSLIWKAHLCKRLGLPESTTEAHAPWKSLLRNAEPMPSQLEAHAGSELLCDGLRARFTGRLGNDRAVRVDAPIPANDCFAAVRTERAAGPNTDETSSPRRYVELTGLWYFEASISDASAPEGSELGWEEGLGAPLFAHLAEPCVSVGLATRAFPLRTKQVGWDRHSIGFHGDDGVLYHRSGMGVRRLGPRFGAGDTVGCGVDLQLGLVFFTLNDMYLGLAFRIGTAVLPFQLFPTVGIDSHQQLSLNFGMQPFRFDVNKLHDLVRAGEKHSRYQMRALQFEAFVDDEAESDEDDDEDDGEEEGESEDEEEDDDEYDEDDILDDEELEVDEESENAESGSAGPVEEGSVPPAVEAA